MSDLTLVSVHWGPNMRSQPSGEVRTLALRLLDAGIDVIHGHSAHVFHGLEVREGKVILYDTGDFIDDYAVDPFLRNDYSFLYLLRMDVTRRRIERVELVPVLISNCQVNVAQGEVRDEIIRIFGQRTRIFGTHYEIVEDRIIISVH